jgi:hypothetical protein
MGDAGSGSKVLDYDVLKRAVEGDARAARIVIEKVLFVVDVVLGPGHSSAQDAASMALEVIWQKFDGFKPTNANGPSASAATWVDRIARLSALTSRRAHRVEVPLEDEDSQTMAPQSAPSCMRTR